MSKITMVGVDPASPNGDYSATVYVCTCGAAMLTLDDCEKHLCLVPQPKTPLDFDIAKTLQQVIFEGGWIR